MKSWKRIFTLGLALLWVGMMTGCSELAPTAPGTTFAEPDTTNPPPCDLTHYAYPEAASLPPAGYQFIARPARTLDDGYDWAIGVVWNWWGNEIWLDDAVTGIDVGANGLPCFATWVGVYRPDLEDLWVEFEPHGLVFTSSQRARISYAGCTLPQGVTAENLTVWYWHEEIGVYELIGGVNHPVEQYFEFDIDHFSRYIVAGPIS
ncbi:MAG: hypothetical protein C4524_00805 [Candidatus Zixiibacteriota bacterium]|nr:MAG: hypothetical protein C4524_00805 [candidate division Zixibacteria bacterium]